MTQFTPRSPSALDTFVASMEKLVETQSAEEALLAAAAVLMRELVRSDDWLEERYARPHAAHYQQYLLHADAAGRYSVVSFVWGPGQETPVHDHGVWGVIGMLRGAEISQPFALSRDRLLPSGAEHRLAQGQTEVLSPAAGDIHKVRNALAGQVSISVHAYGADIGRHRRRVFDPQTGAVKEFISGYANAQEAVT